MTTTAPEVGQEAPSAPPDGRAARWRRGLPLTVPIAAYLLLVLLGVTTSSIGVYWLREDPAHPLGVQLGQSATVRSDEYNTESPLWLGQLALGPHESVNPLSVSPDFFAQLPDGPVSSVVFFEGTALELGPWLPDRTLFAAKWWLPALLLAIGMPLWFRQVTGSLRWGYLGALLVIVSPSSMWWSMRPVNTLGFMFAGCALGIYAMRHVDAGRWVRATLAFLGAGILIARFPSYYQPLAIMIGFPVVFATAAWALARPGRWRDNLIGLGALGLSAALWTGALMLENLPAIRAGLDTVYPGTRTSTSESLPFGRVFGATNFGWLESVGSTAVGTNHTEIASSFTVLLVVVAFLVVAQPWRGTREAQAAFWPVFAVGLFWLSWCTIDWGGLGAHLPIVNRVPGFRASHGTGFVAIFAFCLFMTQWRKSSRWAVPITAGLATAWVSAYAGASLRASFLPGLTTKMIWFSAAVAALAVFGLVRWPHRWQSLAAAGLAATAMTYGANPVLIGLGDLRDSDAAKMFLEKGEASREDGSLWASNSSYVDALMFATGTPALSSRQQIGPDVDEWERLDPARVHEDAWNRGGTYINFDWTSDPGITWTNPSPDIVVMHTSPCTVADRIPELQHVVSDKPLTDSCLTPAGQFEWSGVDQYLYAVD